MVTIAILIHINQPTNQPTNQLTCFNQPTDQLTHQSTNQPTYLLFILDKKLFQLGGDHLAILININQPTNQPINQLMDKASYRGALSQGIWKRSSTLVHGIATRIWTVKWKWKWKRKRWKWHENQLLSHSYLAHLRFEQVMNEKLETIQLTKTVSVWTWLRWNNMICGNRL